MEGSVVASRHRHLVVSGSTRFRQVAYQIGHSVLLGCPPLPGFIVVSKPRKMPGASWLNSVQRPSRFLRGWNRTLMQLDETSCLAYSIPTSNRTSALHRTANLQSALSTNLVLPIGGFMWETMLCLSFQMLINGDIAEWLGEHWVIFRINLLHFQVQTIETVESAVKDRG